MRTPGPHFAFPADCKGWSSRGSGLSAVLLCCPDHDRRWLALVLIRPWRPDLWGPAVRRIVFEVDVTADVEGNATFDGSGPVRFPLGRPPAFDLMTPCGCWSGHRAGPNVDVTWLEIN